jgi:uncharacterized membrane protein YidH (DUF202 family)
MTNSPSLRASFNPWAVLSMACVLLLVVGVLAVVFGNKALQEIKRSGQRGAQLARLGVVLGYVEILSGTILLTALLVINF